jgi:hypothetical protein
MMTKTYLPVKQGHKRFKTFLVKTVLLILGRSFHSASKLDPDIKREIADWEEGFSFMMKVFPHGQAMSIFLPYAFEYNLEKTEPDVARLLLPFGGSEEYARTPADQRARRTIELIKALRQTLFEVCALPRTLKEAGVAREQLETIARKATDDGSLTFNPVEVDYNDALLLLKEAYE